MTKIFDAFSPAMQDMLGRCGLRDFFALVIVQSTGSEAVKQESDVGDLENQAEEFTMKDMKSRNLCIFA